MPVTTVSFVHVTLGQTYTNMKRFQLDTIAVFEGKFIIDAKSEDEARTIFDKHCRMGILRDPMSDVDEVIDFSVDMHPLMESITCVTILPKS